MPGPSPILKARFDADTHGRFVALAKRRRVSESELLRQAVNALLGQGAEVAAPPAQLVPEDAEQDRVTVRLPAFLMKAARARAKARGMALSRWLAALAQSNLAAQPVLAGDELLLVEASNRELGAIGRNINQIARALNEAHYQTERVKVEKLEELADLIKSVRSSIRGLVRASRNSWKADEE